MLKAAQDRAPGIWRFLPQRPSWNSVACEPSGTKYLQFLQAALNDADLFGSKRLSMALADLVRDLSGVQCLL
jgi:hypothetical protein